MVADIDRDIPISIDPLTFCPTLPSYLWSGSQLREFVLPSCSSTCQPLLAVSFLGNWYFPAFRPASQL